MRFSRPFDKAGVDLQFHKPWAEAKPDAEGLERTRSDLWLHGLSPLQPRRMPLGSARSNKTRMAKFVRDTSHIDFPSDCVTRVLAMAADSWQDGDEAMDFGAGSGRDSRALKASGRFNRIWAVDVNLEAKAALEKIGGIDVHIGELPEEPLSKQLGLINANNAFPHITGDVQLVLNGLCMQLRPDGLMGGTFFAADHSWSLNQPLLNFHDAPTVLLMLQRANFDRVELLPEVVNDFVAADGEVVPRWSTLFVTARKRSRPETINEREIAMPSIPLDYDHEPDPIEPFRTASTGRTE